VPSLAIETGGVTTQVENGRTGLLFKLEESPQKWAEQIRALLQNPDRYPEMAEAAYERSCKVLNWEVSAKRVREIITSCVPVRLP